MERDPNLYVHSNACIIDGPGFNSAHNEEPTARLLNPLVSYLLLRKTSPNGPLPSNRDFRMRGLRMNIALLMTEARQLLQSGTVPLIKDHLYRGRGGAFCISPEVLEGLQARFSSRAKQMLLEYRERCVSRESLGSSCCRSADDQGQENALLRLENDRTRAASLDVARRMALARREATCKTGSNKSTREVKRSYRWLQLRRTIRKLRKSQVRKSQEFEFPDGTRAVPMEVKNIVHDPFRVRPEEERGTRLATFCWKWGVLIFKGNKEIRPTGGGWRWTLEARLHEFQHYLRQRADSARGSTWLREAFMAGQTMRMLVVPTARSGCERRIKLVRDSQRAADAFRLITCPSRETVGKLIIPAFNLLFSVEAAKLVSDPRTARVGFCCDGAKLKGYGCVGGVVSVYWAMPDFVDRFGNVQYKTICMRFKLPLAQAPNKIVRALKKCNGEEFPPQAAYAVAKSLYVANMAVHLLKNPHLWVFCMDGASENTGTPGGFAKAVRDNLCSSNSIYDQLVVSRAIWATVYEDAKKSGLQGPLDAFFGGGGLEEFTGRRTLGPPLDTSGPVLKDPETVAFLRTYQAHETRKLVECLGLMRHWFAQWWRNSQWPRFIQGPSARGRLAAAQSWTRTKEGDRTDPVHRNEFLRRLQWRRVVAMENDDKGLAGLDKEDEAKWERGEYTSMEKNPLRFLPGLCQLDGSPLGQVGWCYNHRAHNLSDSFLEYLNKDLLQQAVSLTSYLRCEYYWPRLCAAVNHFLLPREAEKIDAETDFFKTLREAIDQDELMKQTGFDKEKGAAPPVIAALTRWGTAFGALSYSFKNRRLILLAMMRCFANCLETVLHRAASAVFSPEGFESAMFPDLQMEKHAERHFNFLTSVSDILQMAIGHVLNLLVVKPLLAAVSANHGCGAPLTMGLESKIRAILKVFRRDLFVRAFAGHGWGRGWKRRLAIGHRTHGAEYQADPSLRLLNPKAGEAVRRRLGYWPEMQGALAEAAGAISAFVETARECAGRKGPMLPGDSLAIWKACVAGPKMLDADFYNDSYAARMSQAQWLFIQTAENAARCITDAMQRELFAISGPIANLGNTRRMEVLLRTECAGNGRTTVVVPTTFAKPNAVVALVMGRDLLAHHVEKDGMPADEVLKRLPTYARVWSEEGQKQLRQYFETDEAGIEAQIVDAQASLDAWVKTDGTPTPWASTVLSKTVSAYNVLDRCSQEAAHVQSTSGPCEAAFSIVSVIGKMKGFLGIEGTDMLFRKLNYPSCSVDPAAVMQTPDLYWKAEQLVEHCGWRSWVFGRDNQIGDLMRRAQVEADLPLCVKSGGNFTKTNHGGTSRTPRFFKAENGASNKEGKALKARIARIAVRHGVECTDKPALQARAKKIRRDALMRKKRAANERAAFGIANKKIQKDQGTSATALIRRNALMKKTRAAACGIANKKNQNDQRTSATTPSTGARRSRKRSQESLDELDDAANVDGDSAADSRAVDGDESRGFEPAAKQPEPGDRDASGCRSADSDVSEVKSGASKSLQEGESSTTHPPVTRNGAGGSRVPKIGAAAAQMLKKRRGATAPKPRKRRASEECLTESADSDDSDYAHEEGRCAPVRGKRRRQGGSFGPEAHRDPANTNPAGADSAPGAPAIQPAVVADGGAAILAPRIGSRVEIKWNPQEWAKDKDGWCQGVVTAISNGKLRAPGQGKEGKRTVLRGYSVVEYDGGDEYVHLLDPAHNVAVFGNKETAWRLIAEPEDEDEDLPIAQRARKAAKSAGEGKYMKSRDEVEDEDEDAPIFAQRIRKPAETPESAGEGQYMKSQECAGIRSGKAAVRAGINGDDNGTGGAVFSAKRPAVKGSVLSNENVWTLSFSRRWYGFERIKFGKLKRWQGSFVISREVNGSDMSICVEASHSRMHYIFHTEETGPMLINATCLAPPKGEDYSHTVQFYRVYTTGEALRRADSATDRFDEKNALVALGKSSLTKQRDEDRDKKRVTYHSGDVSYWGDIRRVIGAVRWAPLSYRDSSFPKGYWDACRGACRNKTSIIYVGSPFSEESKPR